MRIDEVCTPTWLTLKRLPYPENENALNPFASSASLHIYNVQTKGTQHKSMVKPALKAQGYTS